MDADGTGTKQLTSDKDSETRPTWSPDGRSIAFIANNQLRRTTPKGDDVTTICDVVPRQIASMAWGAGHIVFTGADGPPMLWRVPETGGAKQEVNAGFVADRYLTLPKGKADKLVVTMQAQEPLVAPISRAQRVGTVKVALEGKPVAEFPMIALEEVEPASFFGRTWDTVRLWFRKG